MSPPTLESTMAAAVAEVEVAVATGGPAPADAAPAEPALLPLDAGEQYRFAFDAEACIGCHSCEVACAEQNDLPVDVVWRRVSDLEGGTFPHTRRLSLSMACNHCLEPTCLSGCPTNAYVKLSNGVVRHDAEECIGCQYCIWNCPYEVPVFDERRKIVSKCDMCLPRLEAGQAPACVGACPTQAISVEKVDVRAWRNDHAAAEAPGLPPSGITLSTTRVVLPAALPPDTAPVSDDRHDPEKPHWPLIALTLLTQLSAGALAATVASQLAGARPAGLMTAALAGFLSGAAGLVASLLHLGRPAAALKALRNLRTSWLSREVALFSAFSLVSLGYAAALRRPGAGAAAVPVALGVAAALLGTAGVYVSGRLYLVRARPAWNSLRTVVAFFCTALSTGPLLVLLCLDRAQVPAAWPPALITVSAGAIVAQLGVVAHLLAVLRRHADRQHRGTATLLLDRFRGLLVARLVCAVSAIALLAWALESPVGGPATGGRLAAALAVLGAGELAGRYLFFVTVVPYRTAGRHVGSR